MDEPKKRAVYLKIVHASWVKTKKSRSFINYSGKSLQFEIFYLISNVVTQPAWIIFLPVKKRKKIKILLLYHIP